MGKLNFVYILLIFLSTSCSVEKFNLSPVGDVTSNKANTEFNYTERKNLSVYSSEITNLIATFPKFGNDMVNAEIANLKDHLENYIRAMEAYNIKDLNLSQRNFEKSYKKIQSLRKYLSSDEDQLLNRYMVKIKTNMTLLKSNLSKDSN
jgi:hypothetical protein